METQMIAYHGNEALNVPDTFCLALLQRGCVSVDIANGVVRSNRFSRPRLVGATNTKGYRVASLHLDGYRHQIKLHRLVWIAAFGLPPTGMVIDHINRDKADNRIANLRLADAALNSQNRRSYSGSSNPSAKLTLESAARIRESHARFRSYRRVAKSFGVSASLVAQIVRGERWINS